MATAKIPQDVTREDRLFGPLTLRQFLSILLGSGIVYVAYQGYSIGYLYFIEFAAISLIFGGLAVALAFAKINGRPFGIFLLNLRHFLFVSKRWGWKKEDRTNTAPIKISATDIKDTKAEVVERKSGQAIKMQIDQLASVLDTGGTINPSKDQIVTSQINQVIQPTPQLNIDTSGVEDILSDSD